MGVNKVVVCLLIAAALGMKRSKDVMLKDLEQILCTSDMKGNGKCDLECAYQGDDGGDCTTDTLCALWAGDKWCDPLCYDHAHSWDSGDCAICPPGWYGDGICDIGCNDKQKHDGGDCWKCPDEWIGDGFCDDVCMTKEYKFDGGDCYYYIKI